MGNIQQGKQQQNAANYQAAVYEQQADRERQIGAHNATQIADRNKRMAARQTALLSGTGRSVGGGTELMVQTEFAEDAELERLIALNSADASSTRLKQSASASRAEGNAAKKAGYMRAGTSLLSGAGKAYNLAFG
jgi:hypothetical protein